MIKFRQTRLGNIDKWAAETQELAEKLELQISNDTTLFENLKAKLDEFYGRINEKTHIEFKHDQHDVFEPKWIKLSVEYGIKFRNSYELKESLQTNLVLFC